MEWPGILGHERVLERLRRSIACGRLANAYLFVGPRGVGKWTIALRLAQALLCETPGDRPLTACRSCSGCRMVEAQSHPDLILLCKPADRNFIPIEMLIGDREHRMQEGLCHEISLRPFRGHRKIAIIDDADHLNVEGANCLLKTLEEPPPGSLLVLVGTSEHRQLPTIRSRCQIVRFSPLAAAQIAQLLCDHKWVDNLETARQVASQAAGSLHQALQTLEDDMLAARQALIEQVSRRDFDSVTLIEQVSKFVEAAGKEAPLRRACLQRLIDTAIQFYRDLMRSTSGHLPQAELPQAESVQQAWATWNDAPLAAAQCLERCLDARAQVDANANVATLIAAWLDDLAQISVHSA